MKTKNILSSEERLLKDGLQAELSDSSRNSLREILSNNLNWPYILEESITEGVSCLLYNNLLEFKHLIPQDIWEKFQGIYYKNTHRNIKASQDINIVLSSFNKENLKAIPLKGMFLAEKIYNNIALRAMADIDILVKKEDLPRIDKTLENLGYKTRVHKGLLYNAIEKSYMNSVDYFKTDKTSPALHIHWHIVNVTLPTYMYTKNIKMERFWECARPTRLADAETLELAPHHLILHLAEHALKHSFDRLILLSDIDAVIKKYGGQINWDRLIQETIEFGMERQVYYSLYFSRYFLDSEVPGYVLANLRPKRISFLEQRFFYAVRNNQRNSKLSYFVYLGIIKGIINKLRFILRTLFPPPCVLALSFNLNKSRVGVNDYFLFFKKQLLNLKSCLKLSRRING